MLNNKKLKMKRIGILIFLIAFTQSLFSQEIISGIVKNQYDEPLIGANILILETLDGSATDNDGKFNFSNIRKEFRGSLKFIVQVPTKLCWLAKLEQSLRKYHKGLFNKKRKSLAQIFSPVPTNNLL